jgi:glycogen debranching enzyme
MPSRVQLGLPRIALAEGSSLFVTSPEGRIKPDEELGFFVADTRLLSRYDIRFNHRRWLPVSSAPNTHYSGRWFYVNPGLRRGDRALNPSAASGSGVIRRGAVAMTVERTIRGGVHEDIDITNYGRTPAAFPLRIEAGCDFADLFEVRGLRAERTRHPSVATLEDPPGLRWTYARDDFVRGLALRVVKTDSPARIDAHGLTFEIALEPGQRWHACLHHIPEIGGRPVAAPSACHATMIEEIERARQRWYQTVAGISTPIEPVREAYRQAVEDLTVLRLTAADSAVLHCVVAAGIPWFATLFGRDSLIISLQTLPVTRWFAPAVLRELAALQATEVDDFRDAQPGKILHEIRYGELAHFRQIPHTPYYGTADATLLFVIALHETYRWTGDRGLVEDLLPAAERAVAWLDEYGDFDGDGFQEYVGRSPRGIRHQGWKDSGDGIVQGDGSPAAPPIALVELQGYAFDAKRRMAALYETLNRPADAARLRTEAGTLHDAFEERFWWPEEQTYYFGMDGAKAPIRSVASNAGHVLWSGIAGADHAAGVVKRLLAPDMFSGWGIRTLSAGHPAFNPFAYQLGSVWPHDNGLIALGFARYGFRAEAAQIAAAILQAAEHFQFYQLPELFAGLEREPRAFPVQYLHANVPQGWAAGSVFMFLQALLGLRADAPHRRLLVDPVLPAWLPRLRLNRLSVGDATVDLEFVAEGGRTRLEAVDVTSGELDVVEEPLTPDPT